MSMIKYRVHEVAKDFNVTSKVISQILTDYIAPPKNHMQVLENHELDVIFEYMTQHNQAASLEDILELVAAHALDIGHEPFEQGGVLANSIQSIHALLGIVCHLLISLLHSSLRLQKYENKSK